MNRVRSVSAVLGPLCICLVVFASGCQYQYSSPLPGLLSIRLRTISHNIAFDPLNHFVLKVSYVEAVRNDFARAQIYEDKKAIGRTTTSYNTLDFRAQDSTLVMGEGYLPPGDFLGVDLLITPGENVLLDGYRNIPVDTLPTFDPLLQFRKHFAIKEQVTTNMVITIDLDSSLVQLSNTFLFEPYYYISSVK
jgi:hypothetical protein